MDQGTADRCDPVTIPRQAGIYVRRAREAVLVGLSLEVRGCPEASNPWDVPAKPRRAAAAPHATSPSTTTPSPCA